ncbi:hypothetical protein EJ08DRAFT_694218 [Tothia fuscella]|uniref:DUF7908 domain-containing protein n=1 Tax=Tothia fuscella TaxID=1048955 RepID=A0A9P4U279_9PEZI|nr:hypothetical protein EJ08DRAFT_694218 [Tothia fuscella]
MQLPSIPQLMLGALLSWTCNGQLITITRTLNTCRPRTSISGVLTISPSLTSSGPPISYASTTTIASTVVVSPSPIDNTISAGASFTISVFPAGQSFPKRAVGQLYLTKYGYLSPDASQAAVFNLQDQQLLADGWLESAGFGAASAIFAASPSDGVGPITRAFTVKGGMIQWVYPTFEGGVAQFYIGLYNPPTKKEKRQAQSALYARFSGAPEPGWARASLGAALVSSSSSSASSVVAPTSTRASSIVAPTSTRATSVSIPLLPSEVPSSLQSFNPPGSSYIVSLPSVIISPSGNPQSSTTASSVVISLPSVIISPSGTPQSSTPAPSSTRSSSIAGVVSSTTSSAASQYTVPTYNGFCGADNFWTSCTGSNYGRCCKYIPVWFWVLLYTDA